MILRFSEIIDSLVKWLSRKDISMANLICKFCLVITKVFHNDAGKCNFEYDPLGSENCTEPGYYQGEHIHQNIHIITL